MRIVNKKEFYSLPEGTIYSNFDPHCFNGLKIKEITIFDNLNNPVDFTYQDLIGNLDYNGSDDFMEIIEDAFENGTSFKLDFNSTERDGLYIQDQYFAIYEKEDVINLFNKIKSII